MPKVCPASPSFDSAITLAFLVSDEDEWINEVASAETRLPDAPVIGRGDAANMNS